MARKSITLTALAATLAIAFVPVAATAHDRDDWRSYQYQDERGRHHDRRDERRDHRDQRGYTYGNAYADRYARNDGYAYGDRYAQANGYTYNNGYAQNNGYGYGYAPQRGYVGFQGQRGNDGRCRGNGSTGTIIGAIAGGLIGNSVTGRGDRTLGTVIGGGVGAVAGRAIDRSNNRC